MKLFALLVASTLIGCSSSKVRSTAEATPTAKPTETPAQNTAGSTAASDKKGAPGEAGSVAGADKGAAGGAKVSCKLDKDERVIEKVATTSGCEVKYTKAGETNVIASSTSGSAHCDQVQGKIKGNLEQHGFKCE